MGTRLFIGNLSYNVTEQELREAFTGEGIELRSVRVALDRETGRPRGFAFVETETDEGAKASIEKLSGRILQGRAIIVEEAQAKPAGPRPGGFGGARPRPRWLAGPGGPLAVPVGPRRTSPWSRRSRWPGGPGGPSRWARRLRRPTPSGARRPSGGFRPAACARRGLRAAPAAVDHPARDAIGRRRSDPRGPSRKSKSGATGAGIATRTTM